MGLDIAKMAEDEGTRTVFLGHTDRDVYLAFGQHWGPGPVEVPNSIADSLVEAVARVNRGRRPEDRVDPERPAPRPSLSVKDASDEELLQALIERGVNLPGAPVGPLGDVAPTADGGLTDPNALGGLEKAAVEAKAAAEKVASQQPPPPAILAPTKPAEGA